MVYVVDELTRETCEATDTDGTYTLTGAVAGRFRFEQVRRRDGTPVQSGDICTVTVFFPGGVTIMADATLQFGTVPTIVLQPGAIKKSTATGIPSVAAGTRGEALIAWSVNNVPIIGPNGQPVNPEVFRLPNFVDTARAFAAEIGSEQSEAVIALGVQPIPGDSSQIPTATALDGLGGVFAYDNASSEASDNIDIFADPSGTGRKKRVGIKPFFTERSRVIPGGGAIDLGPFTDPYSEWVIAVVSRKVPSDRLSCAVITGEPGADSAPPAALVDRLIDGGLVRHEPVASNVLRVRSRDSAALPVNITIGRIA